MSTENNQSPTMKCLECAAESGHKAWCSLAAPSGSAMNRWQLARMETQYKMLAQSEHAQEDRIAEHYSAFAHMAMQLRMLCEERRLNGSTSLDETIKYLTAKIREGHQMEFGILLEWPNAELSDSRPL